MCSMQKKPNQERGKENWSKGKSEATNVKKNANEKYEKDPRWCPGSREVGKRTKRLERGWKDWEKGEKPGQRTERLGRDGKEKRTERLGRDGKEKRTERLGRGWKAWKED